MKFSPYSFVRYIILLLIGLFGFNLIYSIFTPITSIPSLLILKLVYPDAYLNGLIQIIVNNDKILLVNACIAGAAYYFLTALNLTTPMACMQRFKSLLFLIGIFLIANILRISLFSYLYLEGFKFFDLAHMSIWYFGSTLFVVLIWFVNVKIFDIKEIPIYSDFKALYKEMTKKSKKK